MKTVIQGYAVFQRETQAPDKHFTTNYLNLQAFRKSEQSCRQLPSKRKKKCYKVQSKYFQLDLLFFNVKKQVQFPSKLQCKILTLNFIKKSMCNVTTKRKILIIAPGFFSKKKKHTSGTVQSDIKVNEIHQPNIYFMFWSLKKNIHWFRSRKGSENNATVK